MDNKRKKIHQSGEDYLETILMLEKRNGQVRSIDIAEELDYSKPSISRAIKILKERKYVTVGDDSFIKLTASGRKIAEEMYDRHNTLAEFIKQLGVDEKIAYEDACQMEHIISKETFNKIKEMTNKKSK